MAEVSLGLVCPACRHARDGVLHVADLVPHPAGLACGWCGLVHPVVDAVPIVLRDPAAWLREELVTVVARPDLPAPVMDRLLVAAGGPLRRSAQRLRTYLGSAHGPLQDWVRATVGDLAGHVLELCCGVGWHGRADVVGVDLDWTLLSRFPGRRVLADALDPPFRAASFDHVVAAGAVDSVRDPWLLLRQADALLRPGGSLVLATPFAWSDEVTPAALQLDEQQLVTFLANQGYRLETGEALWPLQVDPRNRVEHRCFTVVAHKAG